MKYFVFCLRDKKLGAFDLPQFKKEDKEHVLEDTVRSLRLVSPEQSDRSRLADQALYYVGEYDDLTGKLSQLDEEEKLLDFEDYIPRKESVIYGDK